MATRAVDVQTSEAGSAGRRPRREALPYLLLVPSIAVIALINGYPLVQGLTYSVRDGTLLRGGNFVGIQNYLDVFRMDDFRHALWFSALFALGNIVGSYLFGLGLALLLDRDIPGRGFFRVALLLPWIIPSVVSIVSWRWMINDENGLVNIALGWVHVGPIYFLSSEHWAMFSVIMIKVWRSFPFMMVSCLAALQSIDRNLYDAAAVDGAGRWQTFRDVTLPQILGISVVMWILMAIWSVNDFETPWLLTQGGPSNATENLIVLAYKYTFTRNDVGIGAAISFISLAILMALAILMLRRQEAVDRA